MDGENVKATIVESVIGVFGFSEDNKVVAKALFPLDPMEAAKRLRVPPGTVAGWLARAVRALRTRLGGDA